jgi:hypothetical protein
MPPPQQVIEPSVWSYVVDDPAQLAMLPAATTPAIVIAGDTTAACGIADVATANCPDVLKHELLRPVATYPN